MLLYEAHPSLERSLPHIRLGQFPTPVTRLARLGEVLGLEALYLKNDGLSGEVYGGNKVRKLELCLAEAVRKGAREVLTFGYAGSNHALATGIYARRLGLGAISMLIEQPNAAYVRRNLLAAHRVGAELHQRGGPLRLALATALQLSRHTVGSGRLPYLVPPGGSSSVGTVGYVNAALELDAQIRAGQCPQPDSIYVACGSLGTAVGLAIGLKLVARPIRIIAVRVATGRYVNMERLRRLYATTVTLLRDRDPSFPRLELQPNDLQMRKEFLGPGYAIFTAPGNDAVRLAAALEGVDLEGTYTGKTLAALIADARAGAIDRHTVLFWNTYNARDLSPLTSGVDYHELPAAFHRYFERPVQDTMV